MFSTLVENMVKKTAVGFLLGFFDHPHLQSLNDCKFVFWFNDCNFEILGALEEYF